MKIYDCLKTYIDNQKLRYNKFRNTVIMRAASRTSLGELLPAPRAPWACWGMGEIRNLNPCLTKLYFYLMNNIK